MKRTAFNHVHAQCGAKLIEFGGFEMPVHYSSIIDEHRAVRTSVGVFDVSHMGEFRISGPDALALAQKVTTNDVAKLTPGKVQYSAMCYPHGGIVDDLLVYHMGDHYMFVVNAANIPKDFAWVTSNIGSLDVRVEDMSDSFSLLAVQGPCSIDVLKKLTDVELSTVPYYSYVRGQLAGVDMILSRTGYTGEVGFELYFDSSVATAERVWTALMEAGREFNIKPVGLGARDSLRLEMGFCLYGNDIDETTNPLEAGLGWITKLGKQEFIGKEALLAAKNEGIKRRLVGFTVTDEKAFPRHGYEIRIAGAKAGAVTSGTISPVLEKGIGLGYVPATASAPGTDIEISLRNKAAHAQVTKIPFIKK